jgi:cyclopropane fatty-acyl-phospholipid synthase-like methyltransferase
MATFANPRETWNERFADPDYLFGEEPNAFVRETAMRYLKPGQSALCVADGEGRNSVWLSEQGLVVTAFDFAANAVDKARALARRRGVTVDHHLADLQSWRFEPASVDALVAIFIQFLGPEEREVAFARMKAAVKPGGHFLLEGYRPEQLAFGTGGPGAIENLYTREWIEQTFRDWEILEVAAYDAMLTEGKRHVGMSAVIDLVARRPDR